MRRHHWPRLRSGSRIADCDSICIAASKEAEHKAIKDHLHSNYGRDGVISKEMPDPEANGYEGANPNPGNNNRAGHIFQLAPEIRHASMLGPKAPAHVC
jgi:hypothetical protein